MIKFSQSPHFMSLCCRMEPVVPEFSRLHVLLETGVRATTDQQIYKKLDKAKQKL